MSDPVNLNRARKARSLDAKRRRADENAVKFGRTKAEKEQARAHEESRVQRLDQHKHKP